MKVIDLGDFTSEELDRFWSGIAVAGEDECWPGSVSSSENQYSSFSYRGRSVKSHRVAWASENGPIPDGLDVLHSCDYKPCCNPNHLFLGTHKDNMRDMFSKGRRASAKGEQHDMTVLVESQVREIFERYHGSSEESWQIARDYNVCQATIHNIVTGKTWIHTTKDLIARRSRRSRSDLTPTQVKEIFDKYNSGEVFQTELAVEYGVDQSTVSNILRGRTWSHVTGLSEKKKITK